METEKVPAEAVDRLLEAWRGEVQARAVYTILAARERDPRRAEVIRQIAEAEHRHRERVEKRLTELGVPIPAAGSVSVSPWVRLQARLAPVESVLARMEAAEQDEITDRYKRPTGDPGTDRVLAEIRVEEQDHPRSLEGIQAAHQQQPRASSVQS